MSDIALRKPASAVRTRTSVGRKHRGEASDTMRVLGQTAAVAGISGALLLSLKAMVLVAPAVLPNGSGLDALGRPAPNVTAAVEDVAAPVAVGRSVNEAFSVPGAPRVSGVSERNGSSVDRGASSGSGSTTAPRQDNGNGSSGSNPGNSNPGNSNPGGGNTGGGTKAPTVKDKGAVGGVVATLGGVVDDVAPGTGKTVEKTVAPVADTLDSVTKPVTKPVTDLLAGVTGSGSASSSDRGSSSSEALDPVTNLTGSLLGGSSSKGLKLF